LEYKLRYSQYEAFNMDRWVSKKRLNQYQEYKKEQQKQMDEMAKNNTFKMPSIGNIRRFR